MWFYTATQKPISKDTKNKLIDFIKYSINNSCKDVLLNSPFLVFLDVVNTKEGVITRSYQNAFYRGLEFKIYYSTDTHPNGRITVEGSLHKYWNNGAHNHNDFYIHCALEVINDIEMKFNITPDQTRLIQLEIGVNLFPPIRSKTIVNGCMFYKTTPFKDKDTKDEGNYQQAKAQRFYVKIYDKRTHYQNKGFTIDKEILRIEKKYSKSNELHNLGIYTLQDLLNYGLHNFKSELLKMWGNVIYYDKTTLKNHPNRFKYNSTDYWETLTPRQRKYELGKLNKLYKDSPESIKNIISNLISEKVDLLKTNLYQINPLCIELNQYNNTTQPIDPSKRICIISGLNISMQKKGSFLLSITGLKYYFNTDKKIYNEIKRQYLTDKWLNSSFDIQIKEIAHNIRTIRNNQKLKQKKLYPKNQISLFNKELFSISQS